MYATIIQNRSEFFITFTHSASICSTGTGWRAAVSLGEPGHQGKSFISLPILVLVTACDSEKSAKQMLDSGCGNTDSSHPGTAAKKKYDIHRFN